MGHRSIVLLAVIALLAACGGDEPEVAEGPREVADRVLLNGRIFTVNDDSPWAEVVAIRGERIMYVGGTAGAQALIGDATITTDLGGKLVIPGLVDAHTHPGWMGRHAPPGEIDASSREAIVASVKTYADANPDLDWIDMCCWPVSMYDMGRTGPNKRALDRIIPDRPVWLTSDVGHSVWVNSQALELMGVTDHTPDPHPAVSVYMKDVDGKLTGWIKEGAMRQHRLDFFPVDSQRNQDGMDQFLDHLSSLGVTTMMDGGNYLHSDEVYTYLSELDQSGQLPVRIEGVHHLFLPGQEENAVAELKGMQDCYEGDRLKIQTIKIHFDGSNENRTGAVFDAYRDMPGNRGNTVLRTDQLRDLLLELHEAQFNLHLHTVGDRAVRVALDATESAMVVTAGQLYPRIAVAHLDIIDPADYERFRPLRVTAQYTPGWHGSNYDDPVRTALGEQRYARTLIARPLFDDGANVSFSSDITSLAGLEVASPYLGMQIAHNRQYPQDSAVASWGPAESRGPESEKLPMEMIIRAYTLGGAYQLRLEDDLGSIETGKLADLVVLDRDLFQIDRNDIQNARPVAVMMEGKLVSGNLN